MKRAQIAPASLVVFSVTLFALYTQIAWEDWWTAFRSARNLAVGFGPVFTPGEPVQSFSSPLLVLIAAAVTWLTGDTSGMAALWTVRALAALALAAAVALLLDTARALRATPAHCAVLVALIAVDAKTLGFATAGMESAFDVLSVALTLHALLRTRNSFQLGAGWAALMWTRPDGFIRAGALALGCVLFRPVPGTPRQILRAAPVTALLYLPWFAFAWLYYGSPVPNSVLAKSVALSSTPPWNALADYPLRLVAAPLFRDLTFLPAYHDVGGWPAWVAPLALLTPIAALAWVVPGVSRELRAVSLAFMAAHFYIRVFTPQAPWYFPSTCVMGYFTGVLALRDSERVRWPAVRTTSLAAAWAFVLLSAAATVASAHQLRHAQQLIEDGNRKQVGLWLAANAAPRDTVFLEPVGYIGFYSQLKTFDFPGITSREVVAARRRLAAPGLTQGVEWSRLINELRPTWVVLRPHEEALVSGAAPGLLTGVYRRTADFDVTRQVKTVPGIPGRALLEADQRFLVFRRNLLDKR